jgi:hypothetical protein
MKDFKIKAKLKIDRTPFKVYEDLDLDDEIAPNLIHRWGWCILIGLCSAVAIVTAAAVIIGHALD